MKRRRGQAFRVRGAWRVVKTFAVLASGVFGFLVAQPACALVADGYVVKVDSGRVYVDWGTAAGVRAGDRFTLYRRGSELKHPVTGKSLGFADEDIADAVLDRVEAEFSVGRVLSRTLPVVAGDRTRYLEPEGAQAEPEAAASAAVAASAPVARLVWQSEALADDPVGVSLGDLDGDGVQEVVAAFRKRVEVFRWDGKTLKSAAIQRSPGTSRWISIDVASVDRSSPTIFAATFLDGVRRPRTIALQLSSGALRETGSFEGFVREIQRSGEKMLVWQTIGLSQELRVSPPSRVVRAAKGFKAGESIPFGRRRDDQLMGFTFGDFDRDGKEDTAVLEGGEQLRVFFPDKKWSANDAYGGTKADVEYETDRVATLFPRIVTWRRSSGDHLFVPHNISQLGIRMTHLKIYKKSELLLLNWNGLEMATVHRLPLTGYLADYALDRVAGDVWVALGAPGGKTVLALYHLP